MRPCGKYSFNAFSQRTIVTHDTINMPRSKSPKDKKKFVDSALDWLRNNETDVSNLDDPGMESLFSLAGVDPSKPGSLPKDRRQKAMEDAVSF